MTDRKRSRREHREHTALRREMRQLRNELIHLLAVLVPETEPEPKHRVFISGGYVVDANGDPVRVT